ncbi:MAG: hypothetical protein OXF25_01770 [Cyanobacteria bacterium MAG CAR3_bin_5]|nr:hypothetical protein [Cyanobacteria bacterium MAG CAR3_bin_5]
MEALLASLPVSIFCLLAILSFGILLLIVAFLSLGTPTPGALFESPHAGGFCAAFLYSR